MTDFVKGEGLNQRQQRVGGDALFKVCSELV